MSRTTIRIGVLGFEGANAMDIVGPIEAFASASEHLRERAARHAGYETLVIGLSDKAFTTESQVLVKPHCRWSETPPLDTLIVPGGPGLRQARTKAAVAAAIVERGTVTLRIASICTGIFGLAATGLLDGRRVTTHWRWSAEVARRFPALDVCADALFIKDGKFYTGGGITAGIDLALALIEEDHGPRTALAAAREMVVYLKRPGGQEQYSEPLQAQVRSADRFADLVAWIESHLSSDLSVEALAARACLSPRHFSRRFRDAVGRTPADYVEDARLRAARQRLTLRHHTVGGIAAALGFSSADVFRRAFERRFGVSPTRYRECFGLRPSAAASSGYQGVRA